MRNLATPQMLNHLEATLNKTYVLSLEEKQFILKAVKSLNDLLDIAHMALDVAESGDGFRSGVKGIHHGVADRIKEVISQAEAI